MNNVDMKKAVRLETPTHLTLTALFSASLTIILSLIYGILSLLVIAFHSRCDRGMTIPSVARDNFANIIFSVYIQKNECRNSMNFYKITSAQSVLVLSALTFTACMLCLIAACSLISVLLSEKYVRYLHIVANVYVCCCIASLVIDLTFGVHFGMDYGTINGIMNRCVNNVCPGDLLPGEWTVYGLDLMRLGAFSLMILTLKGFLVHVINIALLVLLIVYTFNFQKQLQRNEHSIHSVGALNAYEQKRRNETDMWQVQNDNMFLGTSRGAEVNPSFVSDDDIRSRTPTNRRDPPMTDYGNRPFERSESWQTAGASRPFSYLEEPRRPVPVKPPTSPAVEPQWRREEPQWRKEFSPAVPAPDYSPTSPRRLKSALKPSYM